MQICYQFLTTSIGRILLAVNKGKICYLAFVERTDADQRKELQRRFADAFFVEESTGYAVNLFDLDTEPPLDLIGTDFQEAVWRELLKLKNGELTTYAKIAQAIGRPKAVRAVANAVGQNPVAYFVPCHRVIRSDGKLGGYRWGLEKKRELLALENLL